MDDIIIFIINNAIFSHGNTEIKFNDYIKYNEIKQILYTINNIVILNVDNTILIFYINNMMSNNTIRQNNIQEIKIYKGDKRNDIKQISIKNNQILILRTSGNLELLIFNKDTFKIINITDDITIKHIDSCFHCFIIIKQKDDQSELWKLCFSRPRDCPITKSGSNILGDINTKNKVININVEPKCYLIKILDNYNIKYISCGHYHCIIETYNNEVFGLGSNWSYQLGIKDVIYFNEPVLLPINLKNNKIKKICCVDTYSLILLDNGGLYIFGLFIPFDIKYSETPSLLYEKSEIYDIWTNFEIPIILKYDGTLKYINKSNSILNYQNISFVINDHIKLKWKVEDHHKYSSFFKKRVLDLLLILKHYHIKINIKIPKYVIYMIISYMI